MYQGLWSVLGGLLSAVVPSKGGGRQGNMERRVARIGPESYDYQVYVPGKIQGERGLPVIVFLHGIGQRGTGGFVPVDGAAGALVRHYLEQVPAIILLPQCRPGSYWTAPVMDEMVMTALAQTLAEFDADSHRLYLTGVSMGGYGVWHLASHHLGRFAALVSICGGSPVQSGDRFSTIAQKVGATPTWVFHGSEDRVVPVSESREMVGALKAVGGDVLYSEYEGVGHNVWMNVLAEKELMSWLLAQRLR
ncbi:MAG TPA: dienelactone hydrolase family protein [Pyrinomonadaceae bacterium]|jgi:predicted peptidase|nr:dienelactone hydrolase family protein [Pyrinomonadaceae bacterium]